MRTWTFMSSSQQSLFGGSASNEEKTLEKWKRRKVALCYQEKGAYIMLTFCRVEKEERKEEQEEREKKIGRTKAVAFRRETITGKKTKRKNGKSKPGGDSLSEEGDDDYKPPTHLARLKPREGMVMGVERRRWQRRRKKEEGGAFSPKTDFYYYSGFGPLWCKKRGDGAAGNAENSIRIVVPSSASSSSSASEHDGEDSCRDEEDGVDAGDCEWKVEVRGRKKRGAMRKKVKARSLKTLL